MDKTLRGATEMIAAMTILGSIGWFVIMSGQPAVDVVFWRCVFGALALLAICGLQGALRHRLSWRVAGLAALGGVAIVVNWAMLFSAYGQASISIATAVYNMQPFILVGFGALFLSEKVTATKLGWLAIAFAGVVMIVQAKPDAGYTGANYALGIALAFGAAFFWAVAALITKKLSGTPPHLIALIQVGVGIAMLAPFATWAEPPQGPAETVPLRITGAGRRFDRREDDRRTGSAGQVLPHDGAGNRRRAPRDARAEPHEHGERARGAARPAASRPPPASRAGASAVAH